MKATGTGSRTGWVDIPALMEQPGGLLCRWPQAGVTHLSDASACPWSAPGASCVSRSEVPTSLEAALNSPKGPGNPGAVTELEPVSLPLSGPGGTNSLRC